MTGRRPRAGWLLLVAAALALSWSTTACGDDDEAARVMEIVVPAGTMERLSAGETVRVMPSVIRLAVGDTLRIRNDDSVTQAVGPYTVEAGEQLELTFGSPGHFEGMCPLSEDDRYEIVITE